MKLQALREIPALKQIDTLKDIKPIVKVDVPSVMDLIYLSTNLLYQSHVLMKGESMGDLTAGDLTAGECTSKALLLHQIIQSYDTRNLTLKEVERIRKDFKIKR